jgi:hypothetical protein
LLYIGVTDYDVRMCEGLSNPSNELINIRINKYFGTVDIQLIILREERFTALKK